MWYSDTIHITDEVDDEGYYTGVKIITHSEVTETRLNLYPSNGTIANEIFGDACKFDLMTITTGSPFSKDAVFYSTCPTDADKFDYTVSDMKSSLNFTYYALKKVI